MSTQSSVNSLPLPSPSRSDDDDTSNSTTVPTAGASNGKASPEKKHAQNREWFCLLLAVTVSFVCFLAAGGAFLYVRRTNQRLDANGDLAMVSSSIRSNQGEWKDLRTVLLQELTRIDTALPIKLNDPSSNEYQAMRWMVVQDRAYHDVQRTAHPATTSAHVQSMVQRFAMTTLLLHFDRTPTLDLHECSWQDNGMVECDSDQRIWGMNWTAQVTPVYGTIPVALAHLTNLQALDLSHQQLRGTIPDECYQQWTSLTYLNLAENDMTRIFSGVEESSENTNGANAGLWESLEILKAGNNLLNERVPSRISQWRNLRQLDLQGNRDLTGPLLEYGLPNWPAIQTIELSQTGLTGSIPEGVWLPKLESLAANFVPLTGTLPESLATATNLVTLLLGLSGAHFTGTLPESYKALASLETLSLVNLQGISGTLPESWSAWSNVKSIDLFSNRNITGPIPPAWGEMQRLVLLRLSDTAVSGTIPSSLGNLPLLRELSLFFTQLTGPVPSEICALRKEPFFLHKLSADCAINAQDQAATVSCSQPDCCTDCYRSPQRRLV